MSTTFMNLNLPQVLTTLGPEWAQQIVDAFDVVDEHDHSSGKGVKIKPSGIDINTDLSFADFRAIDLEATQYSSLDSALTGASNANSIHSVSGDLYFTNASGTAIQITSGGSIVSSPAAVQTLEITNLSTDLVISPSDTFVFILTDTNAAREITLPLASSVSAGRIYAICDKNGLSETNAITLDVQGSDTIQGSSSHDLTSPYATTWVIGDGISKWYFL